MGVCTKSTDLVLKKVKVSVAVGNDDGLMSLGRPENSQASLLDNQICSRDGRQSLQEST